MSRRQKDGEATQHGSINGSSLTDHLFERISRRAYELYQLRGTSHGHDTEDWLAAERQVLADMAASPKKAEQ